MSVATVNEQLLILPDPLMISYQDYDVLQVQLWPALVSQCQFTCSCISRIQACILHGKFVYCMESRLYLRASF